jgi:hypothetical protein
MEKVMHEFEGNLLIGGAKLSHIHGELELEHSHEEEDREDHDWDFAGRILLHRQECESLECERRYRLELADGRAGQVVLSRLEPNGDGHMIAEFIAPKARVAK